jgi:tRNA nucleotidyltransferase/poly(A) polymerase
LAQLSAERVRDEWFKGIRTAARVSKLLALWSDVGAARIWLPEIRDAGGGMRDASKAVDKLPRDPVLVTAFLASDPASLLTRLKCSNKDIERGRAIGQWRNKYPDPKHLAAVRRWLAEVGDNADDLLALFTAGPAPRSLLPKVVESVRASQDPLTVKDLAVSGDDLLAAGVRPGPEVGATLQRLLAEVLDDPTRNTRDYLLSRV